MLTVFRQSLIIVLAMLQLFAPLVHAHTGSHNFSQGLHIPGLEPFLPDNHAPVSQKVNFVVDRHTEGFLVVVDAGIKNPHDFIAEIDQSGFALLSFSHLQIKCMPACDSNFSPHCQAVTFRKHFSPLSPRAPPVQVSYA
jgi:hypothetical protein